jgi:hypothetical protein
MATESLPSEAGLTREDLARLEIANTVVSPAMKWTLIIVFLVLVAIPATIDLIVSTRTHGAVPRPWQQLSEVPREALARFRETREIFAANRVVLAGLRAFEDALTDESAVASALRPPAQSILSGALGVGNERVYQGRDGWLFYRPDVEYVIGAPFLDRHTMRRRQESEREWVEQPQPDPRIALIDFKRQLERRGIALIVMPTPVKPVMHPEKLASGHTTAPAQNASYREFLDDLRRSNVTVFDVASELAERNGSATGYLATDTHWRPEAMEQAATLLGQFIQREVPLSATEGGQYQVEPREISNTGDIAAMLDLPAGHALTRPETVTIHRVLDADGQPWRPVRSADVLVLGDSFSNIYSLASLGWGDAAGFVEHLARVLARPVDRIVQNDAAAYATRERLRQDMASGTERLRDKRLVILQFAVRELAVGDWKQIELP